MSVELLVVAFSVEDESLQAEKLNITMSRLIENNTFFIKYNFDY
jgi:hypothetical protein